MNDVIRRNQKTDLRICRKYERLINLKQIVVALVSGVVDLFLGRREIGEKRDRLAGLV